jgi:ubiquinone/menaquinone biosynthesis C-methylase UbiE
MLRTSAAAAVHSDHDYTLGYTDTEHERLIRQALLIAPITERLFREAGIGPGQRVLDLGSGMGDVAMLAARLVGPTGEVVGIERDATSIQRASSRVVSAGLHNVTFMQCDVNDIRTSEPFDAAVGRFILMFLPDPGSLLRSLSRLVRPGGVLAFQEPSWVPMLAMGSRLLLWSQVLAAIHETFLRSRVNPEMGLDLFRVFQEVGLPAPSMHMDVLLSGNAESVEVMLGVLLSVKPMAEKHNVSLRALGSFDTLAERIHCELASMKSAAGFIPIVSAWARKPAE